MHWNLTILGQATAIILIWYGLGPSAGFAATRLAKSFGHDHRVYRRIAVTLGLIPPLGWLYVAVLSIALVPRMASARGASDNAVTR